MAANAKLKVKPYTVWNHIGFTVKGLYVIERSLVISGVILLSYFHPIMPQNSVSSGEVKMEIRYHKIKQVTLT